MKMKTMKISLHAGLLAFTGDAAAFLGASGCAGRALYAQSRAPSLQRQSRPSGNDPSRKMYGTPRRGQSVPRAACGVAMLTLLRLPF
jgi:hypothetical protein